MKLFNYIILITSVHCYKFLKPIKNSDNRPVAKLFRDVINELYLRDKIPFDILTIGEYTNQVLDLFHSLKYAMKDLPIQIKYFPPTKKEKNKKHKKKPRLVFNQSAIIMGIGNAVDEFNLRAHLQNEFPKELRFLIYTLSLKNVVLSNRLNDSNVMNKTIQLYEYFLYVNEKNQNAIDFLTFEWFTADACNKRKINVINTFSKKLQKWKKPFGRVERKFRNFYGCSINATGFQETLEDEFGNIIGPSYDVLDAVGSKANFTIYRQLKYNPKIRTELSKRINLKFLPQIKCVIEFYNESKDHVTTSFENVKFTMMITKGEKYGSYEKLLLPFDVPTWILLLVTFGVAFSTIFIVNHMSKQLQNLLYDGVHFPAFNVLGTFFGIAQNRVPTSNFPRMILMHFILFCLVIRTAYQGVFFEMMAADMRKHVPTSIDSLLKEKYTIYAMKGQDSFVFFDRTVAKVQIVNYKFIEKGQDECIQLKKALSQRAAYITPEVLLKYLSLHCIKDFLVLDKPFFSFPVAMRMQRNHFMFHAINEVVDQTIPAGIPQHWCKMFLDYFYKKTLESNEDLESLKLEDWRFGFELWLACLGISTIIFIIEISQWPNVKKTWFNNRKFMKKRKVMKVKVKRIQVKPFRNDEFWEELGKTLDFEVWEVKA